MELLYLDKNRMIKNHPVTFNGTVFTAKSIAVQHLFIGFIADGRKYNVISLFTAMEQYFTVEAAADIEDTYDHFFDNGIREISFVPDDLVQVLPACCNTHIPVTSPTAPFTFFRQLSNTLKSSNLNVGGVEFRLVGTLFQGILSNPVLVGEGQFIYTPVGLSLGAQYEVFVPSSDFVLATTPTIVTAMEGSEEIEIEVNAVIPN